MALDRDKPAQADLRASAYAFIEGKIHSGEWRITPALRSSNNQELRSTAQPMTLSIRVEGFDVHDSHFELGAVRMIVANAHPTKIARGVRVKLTEFHCQEWYVNERDRCLRLLNLPHILPQKGRNKVSPNGYDIDPSSELAFDFFGVAFRDNSQSICMAPFSGPHDSAATNSMLGDFGVNGYLTKQGYKDFSPKTFHVVVAVICDGYEKIEMALEIRFSAFQSYEHPIITEIARG